MREVKTQSAVQPVVVPTDKIERSILLIRGQKVILDTDLAELYGVSTKVFNQAIKRNKKRFPSDFIFRLTKDEKREVVTNCDHLARLRFSPVHPRAFTEHGALMAANMLNTSRAVTMSVYVIRAFVKMREGLAANAAILSRLAEIDRTLLLHDAALRDIYQRLRPLLEPPPQPPKPQIGFHVKEDVLPYRIRRRAERTR